MKLEQSFEVAAPVDSVWAMLIDVERVAPCLPGAEITEAGDDGTYSGNFQVKLGPTTAAYTGKLSMESLDESSRTATMKASGRDKRGQGSANATIVSRLREAGEGTRVDVETDFTITGRLARFGRGGMMQDISNRLLGEFAQCLQQSLESGGAPSEAGDFEATPPPSGESGPSGLVSAQSGFGESAPSSSETAAGGGAAQPRSPAPRPAEPAKPVQGFSLFISVLRDRIKRFIAERRGRR